jgi:hypothetical protein
LEAEEAVIRGRNMALEDGRRLEITFFEEMLQSEDNQEGLRTLDEKRRPEYRGTMKKGEEEIECQTINASLHEMSLFRPLTTS